MFRTRSVVVVLFAIALGAAGCGGSGQGGPARPAERAASHAVYAEYARDSNKLMQGDLNRRVFNTVEAQAGSDITLGSDGAISLEPGTYRITGFSIVAMQTTFAPPKMLNNNNYPGYCLVL